MLVTYDLVSGELVLDAEDGEPPRHLTAGCLRVAAYGDVILLARADAGTPAVELEVVRQPDRSLDSDHVLVTREARERWRVALQPG